MASLFSIEPTIEDAYSQNASIVLKRCETLELLKSLPDQEISLIITSPPYNVGKEYETKQSIERYLSEQELVIRELVRVLKNSGSICWQIGNYVEKGEIYPLDIFFYDIFKQYGLQLRNRIIWHFNHGLHASKRFSGRYETILWFTKTDDYTFNLNDVRVPQKYPGKRHFKGAKKGEPSGNPLGKNPSDFWELIQTEFDLGLIDIPNVKANHPEKTIHPCQYPIELIERFVLALTNKADWVLDPYCGVGSALLAGLLHERRVMGSDKEQKYTMIANDRIAALLNGNLARRPLGKQVYVPSGREKVAQIPLNWNTEGASP